MAPDRVVHVAAVDHRRIRVALVRHAAEFRRAVARQRRYRAADRRRARQQLRQHHEIAREHRQAIELRGGDHGRGLRLGHFNQRGLAADRDRLGQCRNAEREIEGGVRADHERDAAAYGGKALELGDDFVRTRLQRDGAVPAFAARGERLRAAVRRVGDGHGDAWQCAARVVRDDAGDVRGSANLSGGRSDGKRRDEGECRDKGPCTGLPRT